MTIQEHADNMLAIYTNKTVNGRTSGMGLAELLEYLEGVPVEEMTEVVEVFGKLTGATNES